MRTAWDLPRFWIVACYWNFLLQEWGDSSTGSTTDFKGLYFTQIAPVLPLPELLQRPERLPSALILGLPGSAATQGSLRQRY